MVKNKFSMDSTYNQRDKNPVLYLLNLATNSMGTYFWLIIS